MSLKIDQHIDFLGDVILKRKQTTRRCNWMMAICAGNSANLIVLWFFSHFKFYIVALLIGSVAALLLNFLAARFSRRRMMIYIKLREHWIGYNTAQTLSQKMLHSDQIEAISKSL